MSLFIDFLNGLVDFMFFIICIFCYLMRQFVYIILKTLLVMGFTLCILMSAFYNPFYLFFIFEILIIEATLIFEPSEF